MKNNITLKRIIKLSKIYKHRKVNDDFVVLLLLLCYVVKNKLTINGIKINSFSDFRKYFRNEKDIEKLNRFISNLLSYEEQYDSSDIEIEPIGGAEYYYDTFKYYPIEYYIKLFEILDSNNNPISSIDDYLLLIKNLNGNHYYDSGVSMLISNLAKEGERDSKINIGVANGTSLIKNSDSKMEIIIEPDENAIQRAAIAISLLTKRNNVSYWWNEDLSINRYYYKTGKKTDIVTYQRPLNSYEIDTLCIALLKDAEEENIYDVQKMKDNYSSDVSNEVLVYNDLINRTKKRSILLMPNYIFEKNNFNYNKLLEQIVDRKILNEVIILPKKVFKYTKQQYSIICIDKIGSNDKVKIVDLSDEHLNNVYLQDQILEIYKNRKASFFKYKEIINNNYRIRTFNGKKEKNDTEVKYTINDQDRLIDIRKQIDNIYHELKDGTKGN